MWIKIVLCLAVLFVGFLAIVAMRPSQMFVTREIIIQSSPEKIFPYINNSKKANGWMPWQESDPSVVMNYSGPEEGVGAKSFWNSTGQMGTGEAEVVESVLNQVVKTKLTYTKPFQMEQLAEVSLIPASTGTTVKWSVNGHNGFFFKLMGVFVDCDKMVGGEFEKGLSKLKKQIESNAEFKGSQN